MKNKKDSQHKAALDHPSLTDVNRAREQKEFIDPEKGPENKKKRER